MENICLGPWSSMVTHRLMQCSLHRLPKRGGISKNKLSLSMMGHAISCSTTISHTRSCYFIANHGCSLCCKAVHSRPWYCMVKHETVRSMMVLVRNMSCTRPSICWMSTTKDHQNKIHHGHEFA